MYIFRWVVSSELDMRALEQLSLVCRGFYICARSAQLSYHIKSVTGCLGSGSWRCHIKNSLYIVLGSFNTHIHIYKISLKGP